MRRPGATGSIVGPSGRVLSAAFAYWAVVFAAGFLLGAIRLMVLAPRFGETAAVAIEIPFMLAISWFASRRICRRFATAPRAVPRIVMGAAAFVLLIAAEVAVSVIGFGSTPWSWAASLATAPGLLGLAGQVGFALTPLIQAVKDRGL